MLNLNKHLKLILLTSTLTVFSWALQAQETATPGWLARSRAWAGQALDNRLVGWLTVKSGLTQLIDDIDYD